MTNEWQCETTKCQGYTPNTKPQTDEHLQRLQMCVDCEHTDMCEWCSRWSKDEPKYDADKGTIKCDNCSENGSYKCTKCDGDIYFKRLAVEDEPQTDEHCETCRHKDECEGATYEYKNTEWWCLAYAPIDEPQTDCDHRCVQTEVGCGHEDCQWK